MKKAIVLYQSKTGITKRLAEEISKYITSKGIEAQSLPVADYKDGLIDDSDYVLLGCWTSGFLLFFLQHPDSIWKQFANKLSGLKDKKIALFTTYKIATGSMFNNMRKNLGAHGEQAMVELRSKKGNLTEENKKVLDGFLEKSL
jgi:flavodoxin